AEYLGVHARTAQRYAESLRLPVQHLGTGPKAPVFAIRAELAEWIDCNRPRIKRQATGSPDSAITDDQGLAGPILSRISKLSNLKLYRRNYLLDFRLRPCLPIGVRVTLDC